MPPKQFKKRKFVPLLSGLSALILAHAPLAVAGTPQTPQQADSASGNRFSAYVYTPFLWPWTEATVDIPVCWYASKNQYPSEKEKVRLTIKNSWEAESMVRFTGWGDCEDSPDITQRISIGLATEQEPEIPYSYYGTNASNHTPSMVLDFTPGQRYPDYFGSCNRAGGPDDETCFTWIAVHEFGHALGLVHETMRPDTPFWCTQEEFIDVIMPSPVGDWDIWSVMNYCNPIWSNGGRLSLIDRATVKLYYDHLATADFSDHTVVLPVVRYMNAHYEVTLKTDSAFLNYTVEHIEPTTKQSASPAVFDGLILTVPIIRYTLDGVKWSIAEGITLTYQDATQTLQLTGIQ